MYNENAISIRPTRSVPPDGLNEEASAFWPTLDAMVCKELVSVLVLSWAHLGGGADHSKALAGVHFRVTAVHVSITLISLVRD